MNQEFSGMSQAELMRVLDEAQAQISEIRAELERRKEREQHHAIDEIGLPAMNTKIDWHQVKSFFEQVLEALRSGGTPK